MNFSERLEAAQKRGRPSKIVTVSLNDEVSGRLNALREQLEAEKQKPQDPRLSKKSPIALLLQEIDEVEAEFAGTLVDLKFTRLPGSDWSDLTIVNPPREDSLPDKMVFGYNVHAVTRAAATRSGVLVEGGTERELTEQEWADLFEVLSGSDHERIVNAVYSLNEGDSNQAVELGKALRAATSASEAKSA